MTRRPPEDQPGLFEGPDPGEPEPAQGSRSRPLSIAELNGSVQAEIEAAHPAVWVIGEISNLSKYASGHLYLTLKDSASEIASVMFAGANRRLRFKPAEGTEVLAFGRPTLWVPRGRYQFIIEEMEPRGRGSLLEAFEALKARLAAEGLFDPARKRPIPLVPTRIGVVTSPDGAALRDILRVLRRRHAGVSVLIAPARVQGDGAAQEIAAAIAALGRMGGSDVLIVGRGGGSIEDLWAFNEEVVARAIAASPIPVISAVGHETDVTIADFVADLRAATPSQAAELVVASREELRERLVAARARLLGALRLGIGDARRRFESIAGDPALVRFPDALAELGQQLDDHGARIAGAIAMRLTAARAAWRESSVRLSPRHLLDVVGRRRDRAAALQQRLARAMAGALHERRAGVRGRSDLLGSLSPLRVLDRGYALCLDPVSGLVIRSAAQTSAGREVEVRLARGSLACSVLAARPPQEEP